MKTVNIARPLPYFLEYGPCLRADTANLIGPLTTLFRARNNGLPCFLRQPILSADNPISFSGFLLDNQEKIDESPPKYVHCFCAWCELSCHDLCI